MMAPQADRLGRAAAAAFWLLLGALAALVLLAGPILTSDGPAHVAMANAMLHRGDPAWPMLDRLYEPNPALSPNALGHHLLALLMRVLSPDGAEQAIQLLCLLGVPLAGRLALRRIDPAAGWLALFLVPVALHRLFYLGLYNYCLSMVGWLLCIWAWLGLRERPTAGRAALLGTLALLTLGCQASGWLEATAGLGALTLAAAWQGRAGGAALRLPVLAGLAWLPGLALFLAFAARTQGAEMLFGPGPLDRLIDIARGDPMAVIGRSAAAAALLLMLALAALFVAGLWRARADARLLAAALPLALIGFALVVPDRAGGGWTHVQRAEGFVPAALALACAMVPAGPWLRRTGALAAAAVAATVVAQGIWLQAVHLPPIVAEFAEADALIGPHCTTAPVLAQFKPDVANAARVAHHPLFHQANRIEWRDDRPVLFSYVARLDVYPMRFRAAADPQRLLYGWSPAQGDTHAYRLDVPGYEAASGLRVDYVLAWDLAAGDAPSRYAAALRAIHDGFDLVHRSAGGRLELYRRRGSDGRCG